MNLQLEAAEKKGAVALPFALSLGRHICYVLSFSHSQIPAPEKERKTAKSIAQHLRAREERTKLHPPHSVRVRHLPGPTLLTRVELFRKRYVLRYEMHAVDA